MCINLIKSKIVCSMSLQNGKRLLKKISRRVFGLKNSIVVGYEDLVLLKTIYNNEYFSI